MASSLDSIGHLTKTVWDCAKYLEITAGKDEYDTTTGANIVPAYTEKLNPDLKHLNNLVIGLPKEYYPKELNFEIGDSIKKAIKVFGKHGSKIMEISLRHTEYGIPVYYLIMTSETSTNRGRYDGVRFGKDRTYFTDESKRRIMLGTYSLSAGYIDAYYKKAAQVRTLIKQDFDQAFKKVDIILAPVMPTPAFKFGEKQDPLQMYLADIFTCPASLAGVPSLALPCGFTKSRLPIGMQLIGPHFSEDKLFQIGYIYEQITKWYEKRPVF